MKFSLEGAKATLRGDARLKGKERHAGLGTLATTVVTLEIDASSCWKAVEGLFPGAQIHNKAIAGGEHNGGDWNTRSKIPDSRLQVAYGQTKLGVLDCSAAEIVGKPVLKHVKIGDDSGTTLIMRFRVKLSYEQIKSLVEHFDAEVTVSCAVLQEDLTNVSDDDDPPPSGGNGEGKKTTTRKGKGKATEEKAPTLRTETRDVILKSGAHKVNLAWMDDGVHWALPGRDGQGKEDTEGMALEAAKRVILDALEKPAASQG